MIIKQESVLQLIARRNSNDDRGGKVRRRSPEEKSSEEIALDHWKQIIRVDERMLFWVVGR